MTVKAFRSADLPIELIELLEKIILEPSPFSENKNLQNLLFLTAILSDRGKVISYIQKLDGYDYGEIARIATEHSLYEEAFAIYKKYEQHAMAIDILVDKIVSIDRGLDYANKLGKPEVWSRLAKAQLDGLRVKDAIGEYIIFLQLSSNSLFRLIYQGSGSLELLGSHRDCQPRWKARRPRKVPPNGSQDTPRTQSRYRVGLCLR